MQQQQQQQWKIEKVGSVFCCIYAVNVITHVRTFMDMLVVRTAVQFATCVLIIKSSPCFACTGWLCQQLCSAKQTQTEAKMDN